MSQCLVNGKFDKPIDCLDRGLHYGDGLFETIAYYNGKLRLWQGHMQRLNNACKRLGLPAVAEHQWLDDIRQLATAGENAVFKLIITRGNSQRGYAAPAETCVTRIVSKNPWPATMIQNNVDGIKMTICKTPVSINRVLAGMKHLNRLENVMARSEWSDQAIAEGLMLDDKGHVIEGTMSNLFAVRKGIILTPQLDRAGVQGVMRSALLEWCEKLEYPHKETELSVDDLYHMDEIFMTNSVIGIWPVTAIEQHDFSVGPVTRLIQNTFDMDHDSHEC
ncbi:MAG: aminodeoxychorismate lyase [Gammaproteobacteria bacterium]|nr:MAG: aminodeoxychorismate lyase [Gammaproteobacteria bacterium]